MRSLAAHLGDPAVHDRLPFHPSCPICRQTRLTGRMPADELVPPRTQALLAAGVLAVSSAAPGAVALAAEQDQQQDGTATVMQTTTDPADSPDFDPGGAATDLPNPAPPVPQSAAPADPGNDDNAAVDQTTATNPDDPVVDSGDGSDSTAPAAATTTQPAMLTTPTPATDTSAAPATAPTSAPPATETTTAPSSTPEPAEAQAGTAPSVAPRAVRHASRSSHRQRRHTPAKSTRGGAPQASPAPATMATPTPTVTRPAAAVATAPSAASIDHAKPGDQAHTVQQGESLWSIATDLLGDGATTARVAREVHHLWQLNRDQIGTGDPNLLMVGTKLVLR